MSWLSFSAEVGLALFFGRTNGLVAVGAAMFVIMGGLLGGHDGQVHVAAYVVSGLAFWGVGSFSNSRVQTSGV